MGEAGGGRRQEEAGGRRQEAGGRRQEGNLLHYSEKGFI
jgi:hypothetical protein